MRSAIAQLTPSDVSALCGAEELRPLVQLLLALDERHLKPTEDHPSDDAISSPALHSIRSAMSSLSSCVDELHGAVHSSRQSLAGHHQQLTTLTSSLASAQTSLDHSATSAIACFPYLLSSEVGLWSQEQLSAISAEDAGLDEELLYCAQRAAGEDTQWSEEREEAAEEVQAEVDRLVEALQVAHRSSLHSRLQMAAAQARLDQLRAAPVTSAHQPPPPSTTDEDLQSQPTPPATAPLPFISSPSLLRV